MNKDKIFDIWDLVLYKLEDLDERIKNLEEMHKEGK